MHRCATGGDRSLARGNAEVSSLLGMLLLAASLFSGCALSAYQNEPIEDNPPLTRAAFAIGDTSGRDDVLVALAISGGGSRAAYFASSVMFRLQNVLETADILHEVDVISAVSGGSIPAAYYCISEDIEGEAMPSGRVWDQDLVRKLMSKNYQGRWVGNSFWPFNAFRYLFTAYDRSDIMAQTLEDNLYDKPGWGFPVTFAELNPDRPYLIINATDTTENFGNEAHFGQIFTFTEEHFREKLASDLSQYPVAWAVMASCAFPGVFNTMTLRDFRDLKNPRYVHLFDGGNSDNLGLESIKRVILDAKARGKVYKKVVVILVDSYVNAQGMDGEDYDPRSAISNIFDTNVLDAFDALMMFRRDDLLGQFETGIFDVDKSRKTAVDDLLFWHLTFDNVGVEALDQDGNNLRTMLNRILTNLNISDDDMERLDRAAKLLIHREHPKVKEISNLLFD